MFILNPYRYSVFTNTNSLSFDGTNELVDFGDVLEYDYTDAFSISFFVKFTSFTGGGAIISKLDSSSPNSGYEVSYTSGGSILFSLIQNVSTNRYRKYTTATYSTGVWYSVVCTWDNTNKINIYVDEVNEPLSTLSTLTAFTTTITNNISLQLGARNSTFNGDILLDEIGFWSKRLSGSEITEIGTSPTNLLNHSASANLDTWIRIDGDTISTITDSVGSLSGTPSNMDSSNIKTDVP